jgi:hypothetical protein
MSVYVVSIIIVILVALNFFLGEKLYSVPKDTRYFNNVEKYDCLKNREITPDPKYVVTISISTGVLLGLYLGLSAICGVNGIVVTLATALICVCYLMEITKRISIREGVITLSGFLLKTKQIDISRITGMYIYSYNRKFMKGHAYTVKLVIVDDSGKRTKYTLSSIDNRAVMNMMKENFGIEKNKMYIAKRGVEKL